MELLIPARRGRLRSPRSPSTSTTDDAYTSRTNQGQRSFEDTATAGTGAGARRLTAAEVTPGLRVEGPRLTELRARP